MIDSLLDTTNIIRYHFSPQPNKSATFCFCKDARLRYSSTVTPSCVSARRLSTESTFSQRSRKEREREREISRNKTHCYAAERVKIPYTSRPSIYYQNLTPPPPPAARSSVWQPLKATFVLSPVKLLLERSQDKYFLGRKRSHRKRAPPKDLSIEA